MLISVVDTDNNRNLSPGRYLQGEMSMRRSLVIVALAGLAVLAAALPATACSCYPGDPRDQFYEADAAIVGEYVGSRPSEDADEYEAIYTFNVLEEWKT